MAITLEEHTETPKSPSHPPVPLRQGVVQDQLLPTSTPPTTLSSVYGEESNRTPPDPTYVDPSEASSNETPDDLYKTVYNEIQPHSKTQGEAPSTDTTCNTPVKTAIFTTIDLISLPSC